VIDCARNDFVIDGNIYAIALNGEVFIKRLFKNFDGGITITSDNSDKSQRQNQDRVILHSDMNYLKIIGMAVAISSSKL
jgi:phage repressor protein C with HTH and peptisase S24 domain